MYASTVVKNGVWIMSRSIVQQDETKCFLCGRNGRFDPLEIHHIFGGNPNRQYSDEDGLTVRLCGAGCHRNGQYAVHRNKEIMDDLQRRGQEAYEAQIGTRDKFVKRYGRNYL